MPPSSPPLHIRRRLILFGLGVIAFLLSSLGARVPGIVEAVYGERIGPLITRPLSLLTSQAPFAVADIVILAVIAWELFGLIKGVRAVRSSGRSLKNAIFGGALRLAQDIGVLAFIFYVVWGFNYSRPSIEERLDWPSGGDASATELRRLAEEMVTATNLAYLELHGRPDLGEPTPFIIDRIELEEAIREGWSSAAVRLSMPDRLGDRYGGVKILFWRGLLDRLGIMGVYFPYTAEPIVNPNAPALYQPTSIIHEQAHQRGFAPEDEASFMAVFVGLNTQHPLVRYAAVASIQRSLMTTLSRSDPDAWRILREQKLSGVLRDERDLTEYFRSLQGIGNTVTERVNDAYLRMNRVEGGIFSYGLVVRLIVSWSRINEGQVIPEIAQPPAPP